MAPHVTESECRMAINQTHGLESGKLVGVLPVEVRRAGGQPVSLVADFVK